jgi:hypothetical protein
MVMAHEHEIDGEFLTRSDIAVSDVYGTGDSLTIEGILPCPECDETVSATFEIAGDPIERDIDFPLDDGEAGLD